MELHLTAPDFAAELRVLRVVMDVREAEELSDLSAEC